MPIGRAKGRRQIGRFEPYYEVAESYLGPLWAVKVLSGPGRGGAGLLREVSCPTTDASDRMVAAARAARRVQADGVLAPVEADWSDGSVFAVTDYVEGENLRSLHGLSSVRRKPIELGVALRIATDVLGALTAVHGVLAREGHAFGGVSPDSVLIGTDGQTRLMDVGLSSVAATVEELAGRSERIAYLAPEQVGTYARGVADARTDVFAVGVLLWEMLSNRRLFIGSDQAVAQKVLQGKIPPLDQVKRRGDFELPAALVELVSCALEREPSARFADLSEMLEAIATCGGELASPEEVGDLVKGVAESNIDRRTDAMRDATGRATAAPLGAAAPPVTESAAISPTSETPAHGAPTAARRPRVLGVELGSPPGTLPKRPPEMPRPPGPRKPLPSRPEATEPPAAAGRPKMRTMLGLAPPQGLVSGPQAIPAPPAELMQEADPREADEGTGPPDGAAALKGAPMVQLKAEAEAQPLSFARASAAEPEEPAEGRPDSAVEPIGIGRLAPSARPDGVTPHSPVQPAVRDVIDAGADWPSEAPEPAPPLAEPLPAPPRTPDLSSAPRPGPSSLSPAARPDPLGLPARPATSLPPSALFPSKVPPPLIHDPRAKRPPARAAGQSSFASGILIGALVAVVVVALGIGIGLYVVKDRQAAMEAEAARAATQAQAEQPAAPEPPAEVASAEPAPEPPASASAAPAASASGQKGPDAGRDSGAPEPTASASAPPPPPVAPAPVYRPIRRAPKPKKKKYVPDDI